MDPERLNIVTLVILISLFSSVTNYVAISPAASLLSLLLLPFALSWLQFTRAILPLALLFVLTVIHVAIYDYSQFFNFKFYRRDGNFFVTWAPLMCLGMLRLRIDVEKFLIRFIYFATAINAVVLSVWLASGIALGRGFFTGESTTELYHFLFVAHNAAGGFLAVLAGFTLVLAIARPNFLNLTVLAVNLAGLMFSVSRGSIIGFALAVLFIYGIRPIGRRPMMAIGAMLAINIAGVAYIYADTDMTYLLRIAPLISSVIGNLPQELQAAIDGNTRIRLGTLWPLALHGFLNSPIVGQGFATYNDLPWQIWGWKGLIAFNVSPLVINSDAHAHNTYLHVMVETGLIGLFLLLWMIKRLFEFIRSLGTPIVGRGLELVLWISVISSFSEHRFFTPSQMLPFVLVLSMAMANANAEKAASPAPPKAVG